MLVKAISIEIYIENSYSLKDKRSTIKSLINRIRNRFNVSIAETDDNQIWNKATIGITCISNKASFSDELIESVINFIDNDDRVSIMKISDIV